MKLFLCIPQSEYEPLRILLDKNLGFPNEFFLTSILPNKKPLSDGNCYTAVPKDWSSELLSKYIVSEEVWRNAFSTANKS